MLRARKPVVEGDHTAVVVGPSGEEIYTDKYGRIKVHFHWDREGQSNQDDTCWMRVATSWAGPNYGNIFIPRVGWEVMVSFLEGDPDQPLVTGCLYHALNMPPYELPAHKTRSTLKTRSSKNGAASNFNELRFEDKKGSEQLFIHAEKDMDVRVKNDYREHIGVNYHRYIKGKGADQVTGDYSIEIKGNKKEKIGSDYSLNVGMSHKSKFGMNLHQDVGMNHHDKVGMAYAVDAGMEIHLKSGLNVVIEAGVSLTLKVGGNFVCINPGGVQIQGTMVLINSGGAAGAGGGASPEGPAAPDTPDVADDGSAGTKL
jgi:type VI secretion system secreted protein VgrG